MRFERGGGNAKGGGEEAIAFTASLHGRFLPSPPPLGPSPSSTSSERGDLRKREGAQMEGRRPLPQPPPPSKHLHRRRSAHEPPPELRTNEDVATVHACFCRRRRVRRREGEPDTRRAARKGERERNLRLSWVPATADLPSRCRSIAHELPVVLLRLLHLLLLLASAFAPCFGLCFLLLLELLLEFLLLLLVEFVFLLLLIFLHSASACVDLVVEFVLIC
ncbi:uncharacterized protein DS421_8g248420 [Arachis hypogaea]|nr:uncharacterized protein DS421_8g248420 [Arachis hypogaea]